MAKCLDPMLLSCRITKICRWSLEVASHVMTCSHSNERTSPLLRGYGLHHGCWILLLRSSFEVLQTNPLHWTGQWHLVEFALFERPRNRWAGCHEDPYRAGGSGNKRARGSFNRPHMFVIGPLEYKPICTWLNRYAYILCIYIYISYIVYIYMSYIYILYHIYIYIIYIYWCM